MKINDLSKLIIAIAVCELAGAVGSMFTVPSIPTWYAGLAKPALNPPSWVFAPVWTSLYLLMGISAFLVWQKGLRKKKTKEALGIFAMQLFLNAIWSIIFFGLKSPQWAFLDIVFLWLVIAWTITLFWKISRPAALLLLPYILWVSFAVYLNYSIMVLNQDMVACTADAKLCSDGSYVSRIAPECDFAPCPKEDLIRVEKPVASSAISSPLVVKGSARGSWYFEASFPIKLLDGNGNLVAQHYAQAQGEWMTTEFVPFESVLEFSLPETETGTLVLGKDNPSGLPEHDDELRVPVMFRQDTRTVSLYYYNPELDRDESGSVVCSRQGLVAVERKIPVTQTPIQDSINLLLSGTLTEQEIGQGIETEYPLEGFSLKGASLRNGILTLEFEDSGNMTVGGSCRVGILWFQIEATAKQFSGVEQVRFLPEELFQP